MSSWISDLVAASARHGIPVVVLGGGDPAPTAHDDPEYVGRHDDPPGEAEAEGAALEELAKLRAQVQRLTAAQEADEAEKEVLRKQVAQAQVPGAAPATVVQAGDNGASDDQAVDTLGLADEKLVNKVTRLGYDTIGKLRDAYMGGKLAEAKLKKDWLIDIGMALSGRFARAGGAAPVAAASGAAPAGGSAGGATDVPEGHQDQPWLVRLGVARDKQHKILEMEQELAAKQDAHNKLVAAIKKAGADPEEDERVDELDEQIIEINDDIKLVRAHLVSIKWSMNLDPSPDKTLDETLRLANLGPWMETPQPRLMA